MRMCADVIASSGFQVGKKNSCVCSAGPFGGNFADLLAANVCEISAVSLESRGGPGPNPGPRFKSYAPALKARRAVLFPPELWLC